MQHDEMPTIGDACDPCPETGEPMDTDADVTDPRRLRSSSDHRRDCLACSIRSPCSPVVARHGTPPVVRTASFISKAMLQ